MRCARDETRMSIPFEKSAPSVNTQSLLGDVEERSMPVNFRAKMNDVTVNEPHVVASNRAKMKTIIRLIREHLAILDILSIRASKEVIYDLSEDRCSIIRILLRDIHTATAAMSDHKEKSNA